MIFTNAAAKLSPRYKALKQTADVLAAMRVEAKDDSIAKAVEAFKGVFTSIEVEPKYAIVGSPKTKYNKGQTYKGFYFEGDYCTALAARFDLGLGTLEYVLEFVEMERMHSEETYETIQTPDHKIRASVRSSVKIFAGDKFEAGKLESSTPLHMNTGNAFNMLKLYTSKLSEQILRNAADAELDNYNENIGNDLKTSSDLHIKMKREEQRLSIDIDTLATIKRDELNELLEKGVDKETFEAHFAEAPVNVDINYEGGLEYKSYRGRNWIMSALDYNNRAFMVAPKKRKNSKHRDVLRKNEDGSGWDCYSMIESDDIERDVRNIAQAIAVKTILEAEGVWDVKNED